MTTLPQPSGLELQILNVLWEQGPSTVRAILDALSGEKTRAYTTVLSTMQVMERKGLLIREGAVSGALLYKPAIARKQVRKPALRDMLANVFGGKPSAVMQHLLSDSHIDEAELAEIRRLLDEYTAAPPKPGERKKGKVK